MRRLLALALVALAVGASDASANGWSMNPGYVRLNGGINLSFGHSANGGAQPYQLGPWYQYWPYEAHFQHPAMPQFPYWGAQGLPNGMPHIRPGQPGYGPPPPYWGN